MAVYQTPKQNQLLYTFDKRSIPNM